MAQRGSDDRDPERRSPLLDLRGRHLQQLGHVQRRGVHERPVLAVRRPAVQRLAAPLLGRSQHNGLPGRLERGGDRGRPARSPGLGRRFLRRLRRHTHLGHGCVSSGGQARGHAAPPVDDRRPHLLRRRDQDERLPLHRPDDDRVREGRHDERLEPPDREHRAQPHIRNRGQLRHFQPLDGQRATRSLADGHPGAFEQPIPQPERRHLRAVGAADWHRLFKLRQPDTNGERYQ